MEKERQWERRDEAQDSITKVMYACKGEGRTRSFLERASWRGYRVGVSLRMGYEHCSLFLQKEASYIAMDFKAPIDFSLLVEGTIPLNSSLN